MDNVKVLPKRCHLNGHMIGFITDSRARTLGTLSKDDDDDDGSENVG